MSALVIQRQNCYLWVRYGVAMAKIISASLKGSKTRKPSVPSKRVRGSDGQFVTVRTINADSPSFSDDLSYAFRQNVKRARQENKKILGSSDRVAPKG